MSSKKIIQRLAFTGFGILFLFLSCKRDNGQGNNGSLNPDSIPVRGDWVRIHHPSEPNTLNPYNSANAAAGYIKENIYQSLLGLDPKTEELLPVLVKKLPEITPDSMGFIYEIRPEAVWDNGAPITTKDVVYSMKIIMNPLTDCPGVRVANSVISDVIPDPTNPRKFTMRTSFPYFLGMESTGLIDIIPQYNYDPENLMESYSFAQLKNMPEEVNDPNLLKAAEQFNSQKFAREPEFILGSGPYRLEKWESSIQVILVRKENWWGDKLTSVNEHFHAWPNKIIFKTIPEKLTAFNSLKSEGLDVMRDVPPKEFIETRDKKNIVADHYNVYTPDLFAYSFIAMNNLPPPGRKKLFVDKRVRRAMAHLINMDHVIKNIYYGFGQPAISPISKLRGEKEFNPLLQAIPFDLEKAKSLLKEAGWADTDGNSLLDKVIDGVKIDFEAEIMIAQGSPTGKNLCLHFQDNARQVGIRINIKEMEFNTMNAKTELHEFDMYGINMQASPLSPTLKQPWHSESYIEKTVNMWGFANAEADALIEKIQRTWEPEKRKAMYYLFQQIVYDDQPIIFMLLPKERLLIHHRFRNAKAIRMRPNYRVSSFWVPKEEQKFH